MKMIDVIKKVISSYAQFMLKVQKLQSHYINLLPPFDDDPVTEKIIFQIQKNIKEYLKYHISMNMVIT